MYCMEELLYVRVLVPQVTSRTLYVVLATLLRVVPCDVWELHDVVWKNRFAQLASK